MHGRNEGALATKYPVRLESSACIELREQPESGTDLDASSEWRKRSGVHAEEMGANLDSVQCG